MLDDIKSTFKQGLCEGVSAGTLVRGQGSQEGACDSLKDPVALAIDVLFWFVFSLGVFSTFLVYLENNYVQLT